MDCSQHHSPHHSQNSSSNLDSSTANLHGSSSAAHLGAGLSHAATSSASTNVNGIAVSTNLNVSIVTNAAAHHARQVNAIAASQGDGHLQAAAGSGVHPVAQAGYGHPQQQQQQVPAVSQQQALKALYAQQRQQQQQLQQRRSPVHFAGQTAPSRDQALGTAQLRATSAEVGQGAQTREQPVQGQAQQSLTHHVHQPQQQQQQAGASHPWSVPNPLSSIPPAPSGGAHGGAAAGAPNPLSSLTTNASSNQSRAALQQAVAAATLQTNRQHQQQPQKLTPVPHPLTQQHPDAHAHGLAQQRAQQQRVHQPQQQVQHRAHQQQQVQQYPQQVAAQHQAQQTQQRQQAQHPMYAQQQTQPQQQPELMRLPQQGQHHLHHLQTKQQPSATHSHAVAVQQGPNPSQHLQQQQSQQRKSKVVLSNEAKQALAKAIWSAMKSPDGEPAADLLRAAEATGLPRAAILNAAKVARQREVEKKQAQEAKMKQGQRPVEQRPVHPLQPPVVQHRQQQPMQQAQQVHQRTHASAHSQSIAGHVHSQSHVHSHSQPQISHQQAYNPPLSSSSAQRPVQVTLVSTNHAHPQYHHHQQQQQHHRQPPVHYPPHQHQPYAGHTVHTQTAPRAHYPAQQQVKQQQQQQPRQSQPTVRPPSKPTSHPSGRPAATSAPAPAPTPTPAPENPWRRAQGGTFYVQKGRFMVLNNTLGAYSSRTSACKTLLSIRRPAPKKACVVSKNTLNIAQALQAKLKNERLKMERLVDPNKFRRVKVEPKKHAKALDRAARKARQTAADAMLKQHKEYTKSLLSHQTEFFKFHKNRKSEALKVAKACRDTLDKEEKQKEKEAAQAERARLAALKSNDMTAYSKLLEETKNDRLKFLMDKTEDSFKQISSLLHERGGGPTGAMSSTGKSKEESSYYEKAHFQSEEVRQPSILVGGDLKEYQLGGLQWLVSLYNNKLNGILADEMGLGKTIQAISLISYLMEFKHNLGPYLVIVPLSTLSNWQNEFIKWCPSVRMVCYKGTPAVRKDIYKDQVSKGHFNVLLTTYEYIIKDKKYLRKIDWTYAIVDEGHRMKNAQSKFAVTLGTNYKTEYRVLLTGTPLMNQLSELWSLLNFLLPTIFNSVESFDQWFSRPFSQFGASSAGANGDKESEADQLLTTEERMLIIHRLHELLRPFMLRRVKSEVLDQLPEKVEKVLRCDLSSWQKELYKQISVKAVESNNLLNDSFVEQATPARGLNNVVMQLRKVANHPMLFSPEGYQINDTIVKSSGKVALLDQMLPKLKAAGHRVLIFTQMTQVMTILEDYFSLRGYMSLRLDGSTPADEREKRMYKFNAPDSPYFIFLLSTRAGGLGLNLTAADTVIIFDSDWNPMMDLQAQDRAHRIGQRSDVSVFRLCTNSPVEEKILSRASEKLNTAALVVEAGKFNKGSVESDNSLERKQLMEILLTDFDSFNAPAGPKGPSEKSGSDAGDDDDDASAASEKEDLNELLSNNEKDYALYTEHDERRIRNGIPLVELYVSPDDVPDWIKYPGGKGKQQRNGQQDLGDGSRKRKDVAYDDGLTEKQFLRLMEKQALEEQKQQIDRKKAKKGSKNNAKVSAEADLDDESASDGGHGGPPGTELTDWTFRKLITCTKTVVALKEPGTKRRLADLFLEKPAPQQFPDYYELIEKPIGINDILRKCRGKLYTHFSEYREDWKLMIANAIKFNGEGSWVVKDVLALEKELDRVLKKNGFSEEALPSPGKKKVPKKKLRIKLSLKATAKISEGEGDDVGEQEPPSPLEATHKKKRARTK